MSGNTRATLFLFLIFQLFVWTEAKAAAGAEAAETGVVPAALAVALGLAFLFVLSLMFSARKRLSEAHKRLSELEGASECVSETGGFLSMGSQSGEIIDIAPLIYLLTVDGIVAEANIYAKDLLGVSPGDDLRNACFDRASYDGLTGRLLEQGMVSGEIIELVTATKETSRFLVNLTRIEAIDGTAFVMWGINIERSERQRDAIERNQRDMQNLIDAFPMPIFIFDPVTRSTLYGNTASASLFGFPEREGLAGRQMLGILFEAEGDGGLGEVIDEIIMSDTPVERVVGHVSPIGEAVTLKAICMNFVFLGVSAVIVIIQDISAETKKEAMLESIARGEKEANELKSRFIVNMSHEIRTPLNAILGLSEIQLAGQSNNREEADIFRKINASAKNLLAIVNDILDFSRLEAESLDIMSTSFELEEALQSSLVFVSQRASDKEVSVLADISPELPCEVIGDRMRLWQVLRNILDNAVKFTEQGYVALTVRPVCEDFSGHIIIEFIIGDTGCGMSEEQLKLAFNPFVQFKEKDDSTRGTGLGMSISRRITELLGGNIQAFSKEGEGTRVVIRIPFGRCEGAIKIKDKPGASLLNGKHALVIDGELFTHNAIRATLSSVGMNALFTTAGAATLIIRRAAEAGNPFDVFIIDCVSDEQGAAIAGGIETLVGGEVRILFLVSTKKLVTDFSKQAGEFCEYVEKPFTPSELTGKLQSLLARPEGGGYAPERQSFPTARVLLCEDNMINQEVASGMLEMFGIVPVIAGNGAEAIEKLEEGEFDLVFMDIMMPVLSGHEATVSIRGSEKPFNKVPIVAMTANAFQDEIDKCYSEGMDGYLIKPIDIEQLYNELVKWLGSGGVYVKASEEGEDKVSTIPAIDGINISDGMKRFMNKPEKYEKALLSFARELTKCPKDISAALEAGDIQAARGLAHKIKGIAGNLGADKLHKSSAALEAVYMGGNTNEAALADFVRNSKAIEAGILKAFKGRLHNDAAACPEKGSGGSQEALELLLELRQALERFDPEESDKVIARLRGKEWASVDGEKLNKAFELIDSYLYAEAEEIIDVLLTAGREING